MKETTENPTISKQCPLPAQNKQTISAPIQQSPAGDYKVLFQKYFGSEWQIAYKIAELESGLNPNAVSKTDDHGLMQIHCPLWCDFFGVSREELKNPELNIRLAKIIRDRSDFNAWTSYRNDLYLEY